MHSLSSASFLVLFASVAGCASAEPSPSADPAAVSTADCVQSAATRAPAQAGQKSRVVADFDRDGLPDLLLSDSHGFVVLRGLGDGTFGAPTEYEVPNGAYVSQVAVGDLDTDGVLDVAATIFSDHTDDNGLNFWRGVGDGTFTQAGQRRAETRGRNRAVLIQDLDGDGRGEIVHDSEVGAEKNDVLAVTGTGPSSRVQTIPTGAPLVGVLAGDLDGDGDADLIALHADSFQVVTNSGTGAALALGAEVPLPTGTRSGFLADMNGDRVLDVVTATETSVSIALTRRGATYASERLVEYSIGASSGVLGAGAVFDFDGNGALDVAMPEYGKGSQKEGIRVLYGTGSGSLKRPVFVPVEDVVTDTGTGLMAGDFDRDGRSDVAWLGFQGTVRTLRGGAACVR